MRKLILFSTFLFIAVLGVTIWIFLGSSNHLSRAKDEASIRNLTKRYVKELQTYDYRTIWEPGGLNYLTPDYQELVKSHFPSSIKEFKENKEIEWVNELLYSPNKLLVWDS